MLTTEERVRLVMERADEINDEKEKRKNRLMYAGLATACLVLLTGLTFLISYLSGAAADQMAEGTWPYGNQASVFASGNAGGYIVIAVLAFILGVAVTLFCIRHQKKRKP